MKITLIQGPISYVISDLGPMSRSLEVKDQMIASDCHEWASNHERKSNPNPHPDPNHNPEHNPNPNATLTLTYS